MSQKTIQGTPKLAEAIKRRRQELGLTIEEAASRAGVGTKTWCRYEVGSSIRQDKARGLCKALNWHRMPDEADQDMDVFDLDAYKRHAAWSDDLCDRFGETAAISFAIGSDLVLDYINEDLADLSQRPGGTHIGQLPGSMLKELLPAQFLMQYQYEFLCQLKATVTQLRSTARYNHPVLAHSVIQELLIYLFMEASKFLMESMQQEMEDSGVSGLDQLDDWVFDLFEDMDIVTYLYSDHYLTSDDAYHFDHWADEQFFL